MENKGGVNMKSKHLFVSLAAVAALSLALTSCVLAENVRENKEQQMWGKKNMGQSLNLTPKQKQQIQQQRSSDKQKIVELKDKMRAKRLELKSELEKPATDMNRINAIINEIKELTGQQLELRVNSILATKQILTPEQFKQLQDRKFNNNKKGMPKTR
jgi:Spy/CpxP family protein refolding chaperone